MKKLKQKGYNAYWWLLENHDWFSGGMDVCMVKVNKYGSIDDDERRNTRIDFWLEGGPMNKETNGWTHDIRLDCGANTFEGAIIKFARRVKKDYPPCTDLYGKERKKI